MPYSDIEEAKQVWNKTVDTIEKGKIISEITDKGIRKTYFPKKTENRISHVRPHARDKDDCYSLPVNDKLTNAEEYTKHCFWLNASYVKDEIYMKQPKLVKEYVFCQRNKKEQKRWVTLYIANRAFGV